MTKLKTHWIEEAPPLVVLGNDTESISSPVYITVEQLREMIGSGTIPSEPDPPVDPGGGSQWYDPTLQIPYIYDEIRDAWLSLDRTPFLFNRGKNSDGIYLETLSNKINYHFIGEDSTIVSISASSGSGNNTKSFEIRDDGTLITGGTFSYAGSLSYSNNLANIDISAGTNLQIYVSNVGGGVKETMITLEIAKRYTP